MFAFVSIGYCRGICPCPGGWHCYGDCWYCFQTRKVNLSLLRQRTQRYWRVHGLISCPGILTQTDKFLVYAIFPAVNADFKYHLRWKPCTLSLELSSVCSAFVLVWKNLDYLFWDILQHWATSLSSHCFFKRPVGQ